MVQFLKRLSRQERGPRFQKGESSNNRRQLVSSTFQ